MSRTVAESELLYEQVKGFFWHKEEADFTIRFNGEEMKDWDSIPTPTHEKMFEVRGRFCSEDVEFAGFIHHEGRYCFYFLDRNILKVQYLDNGEIDHFNVRSFSEIDLAQVAKEFRMLQGS